MSNNNNIIINAQMPKIDLDKINIGYSKIYIIPTIDYK